MTNFEMIRKQFLNADTPEKMAELLLHHEIQGIQAHLFECQCRWCEYDGSCLECIKNWLNKEVEE